MSSRLRKNARGGGRDEDGEISLVWYAVPNANKHRGGFMPVFEHNGKLRGLVYGQGYDQATAERMAEAMANEEASHYAGDWKILIEQGAPRRNPSEHVCTARPGQLVMRREKPPGKLTLKAKIGTPQDAANIARDLIADRAYEVFLAFYINVQNCLLGYEEFTEGGIAQVSVRTNAIVRGALVSGAMAVVSAHQHPSGNREPSAEDRALWKHLTLQVEIMGLGMLDNLVVTDEGYYSESQNMFSPYPSGRRKASP